MKHLRHIRLQVLFIGIFLIFFISISSFSAKTNERQENDLSLLTNSLSQTLFPPASAGFSNGSLFLYNSYRNWTHSSSLSASDETAQILAFTLPATQNLEPQYTFIDINGDGLPDLVYSQYEYSGGASIYKMGVFLNKGNAKFDWIYKCVYDQTPGTPQGYYGDCAG